VVNPLAAPRIHPCKVCALVASPGDVTIRLYDAELHYLPLDGAIEYLRAVGFAGTLRNLKGAALRHRHHVDAFIARDGATAPAQEGVSRIPPPIGNVGWVDVNQGVMSVGAQATEILMARLRTKSDTIDTRDLVAIVGAGSSAAAARANAEMKGQIKRAEAFARLASGINRPEPA
jgi:hypothetical protein